MINYCVTLHKRHWTTTPLMWVIVDWHSDCLFIVDCFNINWENYIFIDHEFIARWLMELSRHYVMPHCYDTSEHAPIFHFSLVISRPIDGSTQRMFTPLLLKQRTTVSGFKSQLTNQSFFMWARTMNIKVNY